MMRTLTLTTLSCVFRTRTSLNSKAGLQNIAFVFNNLERRFAYHLGRVINLNSHVSPRFVSITNCS